jgi:hypothetical protein
MYYILNKDCDLKTTLSNQSNTTAFIIQKLSISRPKHVAFE